MFGTTLIFRLLHILAGIAWMGGVVTLSLFVMPAMRSSGSAGRQVMQYLITHTKIAAFFPMLALVTILSGVGLFWRNVSVSAGGWAATPAGMTYSVGGGAAVVAFLVGGLMIGRSFGELQRIGVVSGAPGQPSSDHEERVAFLLARVRSGSRIALTLLIVAAVAMSVGRYV